MEWVKIILRLVPLIAQNSNKTQATIIKTFIRGNLMNNDETFNFSLNHHIHKYMTTKKSNRAWL